MNVMPLMNEDLILQINEIIEKYLWKGSKPKVALDMLSLKKEDGAWWPKTF